MKLIRRWSLAGLTGRIRRVLGGQEGMGVIEVILIVVVLIGLVMIFQQNMKSVVASVFATIQKNAAAIN